MINWKGFLLLLVLLLSVILLRSCNKDDKETILVVPPVSTMSIDFSFLSSKKSGSDTLTNWQYTTVSLALWNKLINKDCEIPITSFGKAVEQKASYIDNNIWQWKYKYTSGSVTINAKLKGKQENDSVDWKLYITTSDQETTNTEFLWIEGKSATDQTGGWWLIYEKPSSPNPYLKMNWSQKDDEAITRCVYINPNDTSSGQYLEYGSIESLSFDSYYNIQLHNSNSILRELNKLNKEGHIKSNLLFSDTLWHCWDSSYQDISCGK